MIVPVLDQDRQMAFVSALIFMYKVANTLRSGASLN